jgi:cell wall-associated NlpC family hydrolase
VIVRPAHLVRRLAAACTMAGCLVAQAAPDPAANTPVNATATAPASPPAGTPANAAAGAALTDPILNLLGERGLLRPLDATTLVETVRNSVRDTASDLVLQAMNFLGVPYKRGGNTEETGFDCSGFTRHIFEHSIGLVLPRRADEQATAAGLLSIRRTELKPGDLVFFNTMRRTFSHVGIYIGDDKFIHSPRAGGSVRIEDMRDSYWARRFTGARRADLSAATGQLPSTR